MKQKLIFFISLVVVLGLISRSHAIKKFLATPLSIEKSVFPVPEEGEENEEQRELYEENRHRAAPGVSWREIEKQNMLNAAALRRGLVNRVDFANGNINGTWSERGPNNQAGSIRAVDYVPASNTIYAISAGGSLWSSVLGSGEWVVRNQSYQFSQTVIKAFSKLGGGERILMAVGLNVYYSDDNGQTIFPVSGITFPNQAGQNQVMGIYRLNDGTNSIYCLTRLFFGTDRHLLFRSTDEGQTFTQIAQFDTGIENVSVCNPHNSNELFIADIGSQIGMIKFYSVTGSSVNLLNSFPYTGGLFNCTLKGTKSGTVDYLYLMIGKSPIYRSTDYGANWTLQTTFTDFSGDKLEVSISDPAQVFYGNAVAFKSVNSAVSFNLVNNWGEYYSDINGKLHADIMEIECFKKTDNTEFEIINCHGGTYVSYDHLTTVINQSVATHRTAQFYHVLTDTIHLNRIFGGSQDQGLQRTLDASNPGLLTFSQELTGDYVRMDLTNDNNFLWAQYPHGRFYVSTDLGNPANQSYIYFWSTPGTQLPNYSWMLATKSTANRSANEIWVGGGNLDGSGGSHLIKATLTTTPFYNITATQFNYDFRANSGPTSNGISAIEQSLIDPNKLFVAAEDGTFFYSNDLGANWNKTASFNGPTNGFLYGASIWSSRVNDNVIWFTGSGYSNPPVYKSVDGGTSFNAMSDGLPSTLVSEIAVTPDERFIFAATDAGPYVYITAENFWYSLADIGVPVQAFTSVEYINAENTVRFSTFGRGIWDFKINTIVPVALSQWQAGKQASSVLCSWKTEQEINCAYFSVEHSMDGSSFTELAKVTASGNSSTPKIIPSCIKIRLQVLITIA